MIMPIWIEQDPEYLKERRAIATFTEREDTGEPIITIRKQTGGETLAHELGHAMSGHKYPPPDIPSETAKRELEAWLWAKRKRGGHLRANIVQRIAANLVNLYPDMSSDEIITTIREAYYDLGEKPPSEEYIQDILARKFWI